MGRKRAFDETDVLDAAVQTFWELGYEATSVDDLTQRTGLSRSSLYATFGSKDELFTSALHHYIEQSVGASLAELERGPDGVAAIRRFFGTLAARAGDGGTLFGCLAANTIAELGLRGSAQRPLLDAYRARINQAFESALGRAADAGEIESHELRLRARTLGTIAIGLFITLRGNPDAAREAHETAEAVEALLRAWAPSPPVAVS